MWLVSGCSCGDLHSAVLLASLLCCRKNRIQKIEVRLSDTIDDVKRKVAETVGVDPARLSALRLYARGRMLDGSKSVGESRLVKDRSRLRLAEQPRSSIWQFMSSGGVRQYEFLFLAYKPFFWWGEVLDMLRKGILVTDCFSAVKCLIFSRMSRLQSRCSWLRTIKKSTSCLLA